ncbi:MAG: hypothetical protein U0514_03625 [Candidatus Andersenbacteria bacterium]
MFNIRYGNRFLLILAAAVLLLAPSTRALATGPIELPHGWYKANNRPGLDRRSLSYDNDVNQRIVTRNDGSACLLWTAQSATSSVDKLLFECWDKTRGVWSGLQNQNGPDELQSTLYTSVIWYNSLAIDTADHPAVAWSAYHWDQASGTNVYDISFRRWNGSSWQGYTGTQDTVYRGAHSGQPVIAINPQNNRPAVTWNETISSYDLELFYSEWNGTTWRGKQGSAPDVISAGPMLLTDRDFKFTNLGVPHVVWEQQDRNTLHVEMLYRIYNGSTWVRFGSAADPLLVDADEPSLDFDSAGNPGLAYTNVSLNQVSSSIEFMRWSGATWRGMAGPNPDIVVPADFYKFVFDPSFAYNASDEPTLVWEFGESNFPPVLGLRVARGTIHGWGGLDGPDYDQIIGDEWDDVDPRLTLDQLSRPMVVWQRRALPNQTETFFAHWL